MNHAKNSFAKVNCEAAADLKNSCTNFLYILSRLMMSLQSRVSILRKLAFIRKAITGATSKKLRCRLHEV